MEELRKKNAGQKCDNGRDVPKCKSPMSRRDKDCEQNRIASHRVRKYLTVADVGEGIKKSARSCEQKRDRE